MVQDQSTIAGLIDALNRLNQNLEVLVATNSKILEGHQELLKKFSSVYSVKNDLAVEPDAFSLLSLPLSLRKTVMVLYRVERATADDLAHETGRLRAVESASANQLVRMGFLKKFRDGRDVYFFIDSPKEETR
jgi:ArsR family transcriptional regulator, lead/cadmium/zinc/bismuth-responsive transcriptional repressor